MNETELCTRCEGSGADPVQGWFDGEGWFDTDRDAHDEVTLCLECRGDGIVVVIDGRTFGSRAHDELKLSA
ncbi:hypothetical protein [Herbiconiux sp. A18JL235]|uniref:Molecular chaperone DnaJ n=1 Tax=Herbiconiux sp. A18JL235 TaxID=3152363 RepID=A0AB39BFF7_9MICO